MWFEPQLSLNEDLSAIIILFIYFFTANDYLLK